MGAIVYDVRKRDFAVARYLLRQARIARETHWRPKYVAWYLNRAGEVRRIAMARGILPHVVPAEKSEPPPLDGWE